ncbi:hypothetical protein KC338_g261 [Hortaea werneckii]|nr:hypothetical protein KC338_g261 [Hortaea werneckii]
MLSDVYRQVHSMHLVRIHQIPSSDILRRFSTAAPPAASSAPSRTLSTLKPSAFDPLHRLLRAYGASKAVEAGEGQTRKHGVVVGLHDPINGRVLGEWASGTGIISLTRPCETSGMLAAAHSSRDLSTRRVEAHERWATACTLVQGAHGKQALDQFKDLRQSRRCRLDDDGAPKIHRVLQKIDCCFAAWLDGAFDDREDHGIWLASSGALRQSFPRALAEAPQCAQRREI